MIPYDLSIKYMIAGYFVIFIIISVYLVSLFIRWQRLKHDLQTFQTMEEKNSS
jgi:hypothetical protein